LTFCTGASVGQIVGVGTPGGSVGVGVGVGEGDSGTVGVGVGMQLSTASYDAVRESVPLCPLVHESANVTVPAFNKFFPVFIMLVFV